MMAGDDLESARSRLKPNDFIVDISICDRLCTVLIAGWSHKLLRQEHRENFPDLTGYETVKLYDRWVCGRDSPEPFCNFFKLRRFMIIC